MQLQTSRFGEIEIDESTVIQLPEGLPGFGDARGFVLLDIEGDDGSLYWLQATDDSDLAFLAAIPWEFFPDYDIVLDDAEEDALGVEDAADLLVLNLLSVDRESDTVTANLLAPIVVNKSTRLGRQVVLQQDLPTKAPLAATDES